MSLYNDYILPRFLSKAMDAPAMKEMRPGVIKHALGVVLEIGIGPGYNLPLYEGVNKLYALEPSAALTKEARGRAEGLAFPVEFISAKAEEIPLPDHSVDTVVSTWTMCSVSDPAKVLSEIKRVLKPGGRFVFVDHGLSPRPTRALLQRVLTPVTRHFTGNCHMDRDIKTLVEASGFTIDPLSQSHERGYPLIFNTHGVAALYG